MSIENNEIILIKVIYFSNSGIIGEQTFPQEITFANIINTFNENYKTETLTMKQQYIYNNIILDENTLIKNLVNIPKGKSKIIELKIEINEKELLNNELDQIMSKIIKPKFYPFGLFVYSPSEGTISLEEYTSNIANKYNLKLISSGSSYCNSPDYFFISGGGVYYKDPINNFWIINKNDYSIELQKMPFPRRDHSMIYIPNQLVLIAGGGDAKCFIFDIQKNIFINWADLNSICNKPALLNYNNYIYCFTQLTKEKNYFERTNISNKYPKWEKVFPKFNRKVYLYNKKIFFVSKCNNNSIIFGAGDNLKQTKKYIFNLNNNEISFLEDKIDIEELDNKTFIAVSKFYNIAIPKYYDRERNILTLNKKTKEIKKIYFYSSNNFNKIKLTEEDDISSEIGNITIKLKDINNKKNNKKKKQNENINNVDLNKNEMNNAHKEFFIQNEKSIMEKSEDDEEKEEKGRTNPKPDKFHISNNLENISNNNNVNLRNNYVNNNNDNNEEINKDLQFGENEEYFNNKNNEKININENEMEDDIQLSRIIKKGDEYDTLDKFTGTESNILNEIGSEKKEMNKTEKKNKSKRMIKLPQVNQKNKENSSLL